MEQKSLDARGNRVNTECQVFFAPSCIFSALQPSYFVDL